MVVDQTCTDVCVKFGGSRSNRSRDLQVAHFVMDERRTTADAGHDIRPNAIRRYAVFPISINVFTIFLVINQEHC